MKNKAGAGSFRSAKTSLLSEFPKEGIFLTLCRTMRTTAEFSSRVMLFRVVFFGVT